MATLADQTIDALRSGHDQLATLVSGLEPDDLARPSAASQWQVSQVLSHLGSGAEISLAGLTAARAGEPAPDAEFNRAVWARWDGMSPAEQAAAFLDANRRLVEAYESLDATGRRELRVKLGFLPQPLDVAGAARFRLGEFSLHQWDVTVAFEPKATLAEAAVPLLLDQIAFMLAWIAKTEPLAGRTATLAVRLHDPERSLGLRLGDTIELTGEPEHPDGELALPAETWLRLVTGRHDPRYLPADLTLTGPFDLDDLRRVFRGF